MLILSLQGREQRELLCGICADCKLATRTPLNSAVYGQICRSSVANALWDRKKDNGTLL